MTDQAKEKRTTRRDFLKVSGMAGLAVFGEKIITNRQPTFIPSSEKNAAEDDGWYPGVCKMCMQGDCFMRVHVVDGVVVSVEGDPRAPTNQGTLCSRGAASIMQLYNPWRIKAPLKRTNPNKGLNEDPGFVEISWDEAIQTVADRFKAAADDDPRKIVYCSGFGVRDLFASRILNTIGSPNNVPSRGSACAYHFGSQYTHNMSPETIMDMDRVEYFINMGRSLGPNVGIASSGTRIMLEALERGCKIINVDPRCGPEATKSEWVPIRPGTDAAFMLGVLNTVLYEIGTIDTWFVKTRTNAPYLVGPDGYYVRDPDSGKPLLWDEVEGRARTFDEIPPMNSAIEGSYDVNGVTASPGFQLIKDAMKEYTPEWAEGICTIPAEKIRTIARDFVDHAHIGSTIEIDGFTFPFRPVGIMYQRGAYQHTIEGVFGDLVTKILCELVGCLEVPGGATGNRVPGPSYHEPDEDGVIRPSGEAAGREWVWPPNEVDGRMFYPVSHTLVYGMAKGILEPEKYNVPYETEVLVSCGGGPVRSGFDREMFEAAYSKVPFHVSFSLTYDENAVLADIVLPDDSFYEKTQYHPGAGSQPHRVMEDSTRGLQWFSWRDATKIQKPYNTKNPDEIMIEIAEKMGILYGEGGYIDQVNSGLRLKEGYTLDLNRKFTLWEASEKYLKQNFGDEYSLESMNDEIGPVYKYLTRGAENHNYYYWPDGTTRHPMYMIQLLKVGQELRKNLEEASLDAVPGWEGDMDFFFQAFQPIPKWIPCPEFDAPAEYDLWALNWKTTLGPYYCGDTYGNVWLHETMSTFDPYEFAIWMNVNTAKKKGLEDGDTIVVESRYGKTQGRLKVTNLIHPDAVGVPSTHGTRSGMDNPIVGEGAYFNALCSTHEKDRAIDPITGGVEEGPAVKVYKA